MGGGTVCFPLARFRAPSAAVHVEGDHGVLFTKGGKLRLPLQEGSAGAVEEDEHVRGASIAVDVHSQRPTRARLHQLHR